MNRKTIITLIIVGILAVAIPAGLYLVQQQQILKSRATVGTYSTIRTITANGAFGGWNQMTEAYRGGTLAPLINSLSPSVRIDLKNIWNAPVPASVSPSTPTLGSLVNERGRGGLVDHGSLYNSFGQLIGEFPEAAVIMGTLPGGRKNWTEYINLSALLDKVDTVTGTPTGTITASSCTTGVGGGTAAHCGTTVNWSTTGVSDASTINVRYDRSNTDVCNATVVWNNPTGPQSANFIDTTGYYFHLCTGTTHLAKVSVKAQGSTGTPTGRISASAVTIPAGQTNGVTRITVDQMQNFGSNALICVVSNAPNASLTTFAAPGSSASWSGNTAASYEGTVGAWIAPGRRYTFNLYNWNSGTANHSDCTGTPVSSVVVDGPSAGSLNISYSPNPPTIVTLPSGQKNGETGITWSTGNGNVGEVWVIDTTPGANGSEILMASNPSGTQWTNGLGTGSQPSTAWLSRGRTYDFRLFPAGHVAGATTPAYLGHVIVAVPPPAVSETSLSLTPCVIGQGGSDASHCGVDITWSAPLGTIPGLNVWVRNGITGGADCSGNEIGAGAIGISGTKNVNNITSAGATVDLCYFNTKLKTVTTGSTACTPSAGDADKVGGARLEDNNIWRAEFLQERGGTQSSRTADFDCSGGNLTNAITIIDSNIWKAGFTANPNR